ncbi:MAG: 30S ribosomal protein S1 [Actinomycetota bacterium]
MEDLIRAIDATIKPFSEGDLVSGRIVKIDPEEVLVDIGYKSEGVIPARELSIRNEIDPSKIVKVGEQIEALVLQKEDKEGRLILSKKRATYERAWGRVEELRRSGESVEGIVIEVVKGGLIVDIGLRGFLPASLVELRRVRDLQQYIGQQVECRIIELDKNRNNVVLSRRAFLEATHSEQRKEFLEALQPGERRKGTVSSIVNFGAFVDLGGVDGLIHVSELSWHHVEHPAEVVQVGQEVEVEVLSVEMDRDRVSLSLKKTQEDPWKIFAAGHSLGEEVKGKITKLVPFGAFVEVAPGIEGLIHISELAEGHIEMPEQVVSLGQELEVRIIDIDLDRRRISLSLKKRPSGDGQPDIVPEIDEAEMEFEAPAPEVPEVAEIAAPAEAPAAAAEPPEAPPEPATAAEPEPPATPEPTASSEEVVPDAPAQMAGEMLQGADDSADESLESIVEEMRRDRA